MKQAIVFFNTENLYDTIDDPIVKDSQFTPEGSKHWTIERYRKKLQDVGNVICEAAGRLPAIIGLAEIENVGVIHDLLDQTELKYKKYNIIHEHSPDSRGIDVSMLYDPDYFEYEFHESIHVKFAWNPSIKTRDILYICGKIYGKRIHILVNHWPSRNKGQKETEEKRLHVADYVRKKLDEIYEEEESPNILLMGDFNDEPDNISLQEILKAKTHKAIEWNELYNLMSEPFVKHKGTNVYHNEWLMLDQFLISNNLLDPNSEIHVSPTKGYIFRRGNVLYETKAGFKKPNETYSGDRYYGGTSDHLAIYCFLSPKNTN